MKIKGTIHQIHVEDNTWIFKYTEDGVDKRIPFIYYSGYYEDGQELDCYLETLAGIERAKPLFPLPNVSKPQDNESEVNEKK
jgi:hypothetical protein